MGGIAESFELLLKICYKIMFQKQAEYDFLRFWALFVIFGKAKYGGEDAYVYLLILDF